LQLKIIIIIIISSSDSELLIIIIPTANARNKYNYKMVLDALASICPLCSYSLERGGRTARKNKVSPWRDVTLLAHRVLPLASYVAPWSVTYADRWRQTHGEQNNAGPLHYMCRRASNDPFADTTGWRMPKIHV